MLKKSSCIKQKLKYKNFGSGTANIIPVHFSSNYGIGRAEEGKVDTEEGLVKDEK